jgi:hypothetical protein
VTQEETEVETLGSYAPWSMVSSEAETEVTSDALSVDNEDWSVRNQVLSDVPLKSRRI